MSYKNTLFSVFTFNGAKFDNYIILNILAEYVKLTRGGSTHIDKKKLKD